VIGVLKVERGFFAAPFALHDRDHRQLLVGLFCPSRASGNPGLQGPVARPWVPACAGATKKRAVGFIDFVARNPEAGGLIPGSGGIRKVRWGRHGSGKRGGVRVIYFYDDPTMPLYHLVIYAKGRRDDLSPDARRTVQGLWRGCRACGARQIRQGSDRKPDRGLRTRRGLDQRGASSYRRSARCARHPPTASNVSTGIRARLPYSVGDAKELGAGPPPARCSRRGFPPSDR
jgi:hypothetical protein